VSTSTTPPGGEPPEGSVAFAEARLDAFLADSSRTAGSPKSEPELIAFDIDGVLTDFRVGPIFSEAVDKHQAVVISGRTFAEYDWQCKGLSQMCPVYIRGAGEYGNRRQAGWFKARMSHVLGVTKFYEDDPEQIAIIRARNPDIEIVRVGEDV
jgi:hypothetical protein